MEHHRQSLRIGAWAVCCALILRLGSNGFFDPLAAFLAKPNIASLLLYLETGRFVRFSQSLEAAPVFFGESPPPEFPSREEPEETFPVFSESDAADIAVKYGCSYRPDLAQLLVKPLTLSLKKAGPTVLILHTHTTESYTRSQGETYEETAAFRTLDENYNMLSVGDHLASLLEQGGIQVIHDRQVHDYPSYNGSYNHARKAINAALKEYPSIDLVLDLHRDASGDNQNQMKTAATVDGQPSAQIMLVVGTNAAGLKHPHWEENLGLATKLHVQLERIAPGITRHINLRAQRFNQDMHPRALLVEIGAAGNTHREALTAAEVLAQGILDLSAIKDSTS